MLSPTETIIGPGVGVTWEGASTAGDETASVALVAIGGTGVVDSARAQAESTIAGMRISMQTYFIGLALQVIQEPSKMQMLLL